MLKGILKRGFEKKCFDLKMIDLRDFGIGAHKKIDDSPFFKKQGMLCRSDVLEKAITSIADYQNMRIIYTCPKGSVWNQQRSKDLVKSKQDIILISGYYEGVDERIFECYPIERVSLGDYIVNSGDCAVAVIAETLLRQCPGVLGNSACIENDSHFEPLLEHPHYTHPVTFHDQTVPDVLRSGNHQAGNDYNKRQSMRQTLVQRPDLLGKKVFLETDKTIMTAVINEMVVKQDERN